MYHPEGPTFVELVQQALASTERGYDLIAPKFDRTPFRTPDGVLEALAQVIGPARSIDAALDVCCGTGAAMIHLLPLVRKRLVGVDFSTGMLDEARLRLDRAADSSRTAAASGGPPSIELVRGDALELSFDAEMDVVTSVGAFGHVLPEDEDRFVAGIARALKPGGRFVFATGPRPTVRHSSFWLAHGFNAVMRVRNAVLRPQFIMYYLTFLWPEVKPLLERHGFVVEAQAGRCPPPYERVIIVSATRSR